MKYVGGKGRVASHIVGYLTNVRQPKQSYWEPFAGAMYVLSRMDIRDANVYGSDAQLYLMSMWIAIQSGWTPPTDHNRKLYQLAREQAVYGNPNGFTDAELGYYGFVLSFMGKWFAGYCDSVSNWEVLPAQLSSAERKFNRLRNNVHLFCADFMKTEPPEKQMLIYCDPPYAGTLGYAGTPPFDHEAFWLRVRDLTEQGHTVVVSEYEAPAGFSCVLEMETNLQFGAIEPNQERPKRVEKLFRWGQYQPPQLSFF